MTDEILELAEAVRPKLVADGMFLVGLDIVDNKLLEINVQTPGGLNSAGQLAGEDFIKEVIHALERKVAHAKEQGRVFDNVILATL